MEPMRSPDSMDGDATNMSQPKRRIAPAATAAAHSSLNHSHEMNLSRDDSDVGGEEYFFHPVPPRNENLLAFSFSMSPDHPGLGGADGATVQQPPRIASSSSLMALYGEEIVSSASPSHALSQQAYMNDSSGGLSYLQSPLLQPQFRPTERATNEDEEEEVFGSLSTNTDDENLGDLLSPRTFSTIPMDDCAATITPPPSTQYTLQSLSPPPLISKEVSEQHPPELTIQPSLSRESLVGGSDSTGGGDGPSLTQRPHRPPRAPTSHASTQRAAHPMAPNAPPPPPNTSSGMSSVPIATTKMGHHQRVLSTGDASILSALTTDSAVEDEAAAFAAAKKHAQMFRGSSDSRSWNDSYRPNSIAHEFHLSQRRRRRSNEDDQPVMAMEGINIDIPSCIQQPILGDENENIFHEPFLQQNHMLGNLPISTENHIPSISDLSPVLHTSDLLAAATDPVFVQRAEAEDSDAPTPRIFHQKLPKLSEYETEAETAILAAIDDEVRRVRRNSDNSKIRKVIFPNLSRDESENLQPVPSTSSDDDNLSTAFMQWYTLQNAEMDAHHSIVRRRSVTRSSVQNSTAAMDQTTVHASRLMEASQRRNSVRAKSSLTNSFRRSAHQSFGTPGTISENADSMDAADHDDRAMEEAEAGKRKVFFKFTDAAMNLPRRTKESLHQSVQKLKQDWVVFEELIRPQKETAIGFFRNLVSFCIIPSLTLAFTLFYVFDNPGTGRTSPNYVSTGKASVSWWIIFLGVRHPLIWTLARASQFLFSNFFGASSPRFMKLVGPRIGIVLAHSKGWPCEVLFYSMFCLQFLYGEYRFVKHWLYWQNWLIIFTAANPAGNVTTRETYFRALITFIVVGVTVSIKRVWLGYYFGRRICARYSDDLHELLVKLVLLSEVATLSVASKLHSPSGDINVSIDAASHNTCDKGPGKAGDDWDSSRRDIVNYLEEWDEPFQSNKTENNGSTLKDILEFRQTVDLMQTEYPFSKLFGRADSRDACTASSAKVYEKLVTSQEGENTNLKFATLAEIATNNNGQINQKKMKRLIDLFRPNKDKELSLLDFTRCVDSVYRELRTLSAGIGNATAIERVFEMMLNFVFYFILMFVCLAVLGVDALAFGVTVTGWVLALSFVIGSACSSTFEGIIMILVRRPYDIGDRIALSNVDDDTDPTGSLGWIVEDIDIFYTTVRYGATREVATLANGSLARSRIINARRSDDAQLMLRLKFGIEGTSSEQLKLFQRALEKFIEDRPQEFHNSVAFRLAIVEVDLGFFEYTIIVQCRSSWQKIRSVLDSRAKISSFCFELQKKLGMRYISPPMPINLNLNDIPELRHAKPAGASPLRGSAAEVRASHRDSDLFYSTKSERNSTTGSFVDDIVAQLAEAKKDR